MKKKIGILICGMIFFVVGIYIANENTVQLGFEENTKIVYSDEESVTVMNYTIYYDNIKKCYKTAEKYVPNDIMAYVYNVYSI